jgi:predicted enzyme related to lactoylglutathione lyase
VAARIEIGIDTTDPEALAPFWAAALDYAIGDMDTDGIYLDLVPPQAGRPVVYLQRVPEPKSVKNRLHLDLMVSQPEQTIELLVSLGAKRLGEAMTGSEGGWWQVMSDPEGNEFCVCSSE